MKVNETKQTEQGDPPSNVSFNPRLTRPDTIVLKSLFQDISNAQALPDASDTQRKDADSIEFLDRLNTEESDMFQPTVFTGWDNLENHIPDFVNQYFLQPYIKWAQGIVRWPTDVVFLTHIMLYFTTSVPSAIYLYYSFSWPHGVFHSLMQLSYCGPFTLMLHNHIHNNGVLAKKYAWFDRSFPFILEPLMGHTWNSYYFHHVKHHHVENNGPHDLSSTIRYQRDNFTDFLQYVGRFLAFVWIELPLYFLRTNKRTLALKSFVSEVASSTVNFLLAKYNFRPTLFGFILPLIAMRIGLMAGNWGQHAFVDEVDPKSNFRSSITVIDVSSNRHCFNDGYHTSHHLNPRRHWRKHPMSFLKAKKQYQTEHALVFQNVDYLIITFKLLQKDYDYLASRLIPMGDQVRMSHVELMALLKTKTRKFTEDDIKQKFQST